MAEGVKLDYLSVGGNRHPSSADWSTAHGGLLAYGAGNSIALWSPLVRSRTRNLSQLAAYIPIVFQT